MANIKKKFRELTVGGISNFRRKVTPIIRIQGLWLQELGFQVGAPVLVTCENGKIIITPDTAKKEMQKREEIEMKKLQDKFLAEKELLHAQLVAECRAEYGKKEN